MNINDALVWIISGGGAAWAGFWLVERITWLAAQPAARKRLLAFALTGLLAVGAWVALTALSGAVWPLTWESWVNQLFAVAAGAIIAGQAVHGALAMTRPAKWPVK